MKTLTSNVDSEILKQAIKETINDIVNPFLIEVLIALVLLGYAFLLVYELKIYAPLVFLMTAISLWFIIPIKSKYDKLVRDKQHNQEKMWERLGS